MVEDLIRRAQRRYLLNEALGQGAFAVSICAGGLVALLLVGTRYLGWWAVGASACAGIAVGVFRIYRRTPDAYGTAIRLDEKAGLHDALSTALYFAGHAEGAEAFRRSQRAQTETAIGAVTLDEAVPFTFPRAVYAMAALGLLAAGLAGWRYHLGLNSRSPVGLALLRDRAPNDLQQEGKKADRRQWMQDAQLLLSRLGVKSDGQPPLESQAELDKALDQALQANPSATDQRGGAKSAEDSRRSPESGDPMELTQDQKDEMPGTLDASGIKTDATQQSGLFSKLKQAVSSLLSKAPPMDDNDANSNEPTQEQSDANLSGEQRSLGKNRPDHGESMSDAMQGKANAQSQPGQKGKLNSSEDEKGQGSGIGNQDGLREQREAEQLQAMGKISEIIGKRASTVSGEMMVEVQSGRNQQLRTAYTNTVATHGEADGEVTRDEIPLSLQPYVQQYFEQVRKSTAPRTAASHKGTK